MTRRSAPAGTDMSSFSPSTPNLASSQRNMYLNRWKRRGRQGGRQGRRPPTVRRGTHVTPSHNQRSNQRGTERRNSGCLDRSSVQTFPSLSPSHAFALRLLRLIASTPSTPLSFPLARSLSLSLSLVLSLALSPHMVRCATPPSLCPRARALSLSLSLTPHAQAPDPLLLFRFSPTHMSSVNRGISALLTISAFFASHRPYRSAREKIPCFVNSFW